VTVLAEAAGIAFLHDLRVRIIPVSGSGIAVRARARLRLTAGAASSTGRCPAIGPPKDHRQLGQAITARARDGRRSTQVKGEQARAVHAELTAYFAHKTGFSL